MKNAGMAGAVALVGIGLITIGLSNFSNRAEAVPSAVANAGPGGPVIVAFGSLGLSQDMGNTNDGINASGGFYRLWSDGRLEVRRLGFLDASRSAACAGHPLLRDGRCSTSSPWQIADTGWITLPDPPGGNGFACRSDINGDRNIDAQDLGLLLAGWGQDISCDPQPSYPCFDLNGLNLNLAAR